MKIAIRPALFIALLALCMPACAEPAQERVRETVEYGDPRILSDNYAAIARAEAEKGHREAMLAYANHLDALEKYADAAVWFDRHAETGSRDEQLRLGQWYLGTAGRKQPALRARGERWLKAASRGKDNTAREAGETLGWFYVQAGQKRGNLEKARAAYQHIAELGSTDAAYQLGRLYQRKDAPFKDLKRAVYWYERAARSGHADAQEALGDAYGAGEGVAWDVEEAARWWTLAARQGSENAAKRLRSFGYPVPADVTPPRSSEFAPAPSERRDTRTERTILPPPREFPVWFGTNRKPVNPKNYKQGFTGKLDSVVHYGLSKVLVPEGHEFGSVAPAWYQKFTVGQDGSLRLLTQEKLSSDEFGAGVASWAAQWRDDEPAMLIFIHGFNVAFKDAILRAAQMGYDLKVRGPVLAFSWPSLGDLGPRDYATDENSVVVSQPAIHDFLIRATQIAAQAKIKKVHLIAHSMGNRGLMESILYGNSAAPNARLRFDQVFLAAPDMDKVRFAQLAKLYTESTRVKAKRTTLYVSPRDWALGASEWVHRNNSIGRTPPIPVLPGIQTVEVSGIDLGLLGHSYIFEAEKVLTDMKELMDHNKEPGRRIFPKQAKTDDGKNFWRISK